MMFAWLAADELRMMVILASAGYGHWAKRELAFGFLKLAIGR